MTAAFAYFLEGVQIWAGDTRAPEFSDDVVEMQVRHWDGYRADTGAMNWRGNDNRPFAHDLTALPMGFKRALCERIWVKCNEAGLWEDARYMEGVRKRREMASGGNNILDAPA